MRWDELVISLPRIDECGRMLNDRNEAKQTYIFICTNEHSTNTLCVLVGEAYSSNQATLTLYSLKSHYLCIHHHYTIIGIICAVYTTIDLICAAVIKSKQLATISAITKTPPPRGMQHLSSLDSVTKVSKYMYVNMHTFNSAKSKLRGSHYKRPVKLLL